jgi:hypothetical protein
MANFDLVNWTMRKARQLSPIDQMQKETEGSHLLDKLLEVLEDTRTKPPNFAANPKQAINRNASAPSTHLSDDGPLAAEPGELADRTGANTTSDLAVSTQAAPLAPADVPVIPLPALLKAIVEPDLRKDHPVDRERAIKLRWVMRDIKANRLKLSPVSQRDLQELVTMGLVEIRNDVPLLTNTGVNAIF